ncbi:tRNA lysidine(34) synthetase TilS [Paenibacillus sp. y28]|uniref:tRNA lysidine(34) synthetase TilS n=1 Tax=Paenibacillus sp. y28 TaxID=3129110 RepID=UPI003017301D
MQLLERVERDIREQELLRQGSVLIVAVSGGADSTALLHMLHKLSEEWSWRLVVAHVNHMFRGDESLAEARQVEALARSLGLPCETAHIDIPGYLQSRAMNPQDASRERRYAFLLETAGRYGASAIVLAHHADDQAETVLLHLLRGSGGSGLSGMAFKRIEKNVELVRPLLRIYKTELLKYCSDNGLLFSEDSSNAERKYARNRIRLDALPYLRQFNPRISEALVRLAETNRAEDDYLQGVAAGWLQQHGRSIGPGYAFSREAFIKEHVALQRRVIKLILSYVFSGGGSVDFSAIERIRRAAAQQRKSNIHIEVPGAARMVRVYDEIRLERTTNKSKADYSYALSKNEALQAGILELPEAEGVLFYEVRSHEGVICRPKPASFLDEAQFALEQLEFPLVVRSRLAGDRMEVLGLNGSKKVKDIYIDDKVAPDVRSRLPLVCDASGRVLWIPGIRRSRHALPDGETGDQPRLILGFGARM